MINYTLLLTQDEAMKHIQRVSDNNDVFLLFVSFFFCKHQLIKKIAMKKLDEKIFVFNAIILKLGNISLQFLLLHISSGCDSVLSFWQIQNICYKPDNSFWKHRLSLCCWIKQYFTHDWTPLHGVQKKKRILVKM